MGFVVGFSGFSLLISFCKIFIIISANRVSRYLQSGFMGLFVFYCWLCGCFYTAKVICTNPVR